MAKIKDAIERGDLEDSLDEPGLTPKEWRNALDRYLTTGEMDPEAYVMMDFRQKDIIQEIKRSVKRIKYNSK